MRASSFVFAVLMAATSLAIAAGPFDDSPPPPAPKPMVAQAHQELAAANKEFHGAVKSLNDVLAQMPVKVEPARWTTVKQGAAEIKTKAGQLRQAIEAAKTTSDELGIANGRLTARLDEIGGEFTRLADAADAQAKTLSEPLAGVVKREKLMWARWAKVTVNFKEHYAQTLAKLQKQTEDLAVVDPILVRLDKGADQLVELASVGERLDQQMATLSSLADELNAVITAFGVLADQTRTVLAQNPLNPAAGLAALGDSPYRTWTDNEGRTIIARQVSVRGAFCRLQGRATGRLYDVPIDSLSLGDRIEIQQVETFDRVASVP